MRINEGRYDRLIRLIIGLGLLSAVFIGPKSNWGYIGMIPLLTALVGFCPLYRLIGLNTCQLR